jgi:uncharacterized protein YdaU (DUF1376 family)
VKFYKRFPGDIQIKTGGLTLAEFGAYDRLLDHYYATEEPIAPDEVYSITRALTKVDREAVDKVLRKFFDREALGYTQQRADEMIAEAQPKIEAARTNGLKGGRPKTKPSQTEQKPNGLVAETKDEPNAKTSQSQSSLSPSEKRTPRKSAPPTLDPGDLLDAGFDMTTAAEFIAHKAAVKAPLTARAWADHLSESTKAGWSPVAAAVKVIAKNWKGFEAKYVANEPKRDGAVVPLAPKSFAEQNAAASRAIGNAWMGSAAPDKRRDYIDMQEDSSDAARLTTG